MMAEENVKLEKLPDAPVHTGGVVPTKHEHNYLMMAVRQAHEAGLCPQGETAPQTYLKLQRARELRIPLNTALALLYVVKGRIATMGRLKLALVRKSGRYQYRFEEVADPRQEAKFTIWPKGSPEEAYTAHWTIERAREGGLLEKFGKPVVVWAQYPDYMLRWRAVSEAVDLVAPDVCDLPLVEELAESFDLGPNGAVTNIQDKPDLLPRVASAEEDGLPELPVNEETGWQMPQEWARKALERMGRLGWSRELAAQTLASCKSPEDAQELKDALDEEEAAAGHGTSQRLFGEADNAPA